MFVTTEKIGAYLNRTRSRHQTRPSTLFSPVFSLAREKTGAVGGRLPKTSTPFTEVYYETPLSANRKIVSTHGVHGEVKLLPWADGPEFLLQFHTLYLDGRPYQVEQSRVQKTCVLLKLEGIDTVEAASALRDKIVSIARADAKLQRAVCLSPIF